MIDSERVKCEDSSYHKANVRTVCVRNKTIHKKRFRLRLRYTCNKY